MLIIKKTIQACCVMSTFTEKARNSKKFHKKMLQRFSKVYLLGT